MAKQKFIFFTDVHFHNYSNMSKPTGNPYIGSRFQEQLDVMRKVFELAKQHNATLINGGDLFHKRANVDTVVFNKVHELFCNAPELQIHHCVGNHDKVANAYEAPSIMESFDFLFGNYVCSKPMIIRTHSDNNINIYMVPYGQESEQAKAFINNLELAPDQTHILVGHFGVDGASSGSSSHQLGGSFKYGDLRPDEMDYILLGHYHKRQLLGDHQNPNHLYGGSLLQNNFGEQHVPGVHLLTIDSEDKTKNTIEFIEIPSTRFITVTDTNIPDNIEELLETHYVRFIGSTASVKALANVKEDLSNVQIEIERDYTTDLRIDIQEDSSPVDVTLAYVKEFSPEATDEALSCIKEALSS